MQSRWGARSIAFSCERELQQGRCQRALACDGQQRAPPHGPRDLGSGADLSGRIARPGPGEEAQERDRLVSPTPAGLHAEHDEPAAPAAHELRVRSALALRCARKGPPWVSAVPACASPFLEDPELPWRRLEACRAQAGGGSASRTVAGRGSQAGCGEEQPRNAREHPGMVGTYRPPTRPCIFFFPSRLFPPRASRHYYVLDRTPAS